MRHLYASPCYLAQHGEPADAANLAQHSCLGLTKSGTWTLMDGDQSVPVAVGSRFAINSVGLMRRIATLDMGILLLPDEIVTDDVAAGRLQRILPQWHGKPTPVYARAETRLVPAKTARFIEFLRERLAPPG